ncbi:uncharacterized protein CYBJADRAFT_166383, partial [Cyberlindnera jadinii NRRL Y-1542]
IQLKPIASNQRNMGSIDNLKARNQTSMLYETTHKGGYTRTPGECTCQGINKVEPRYL